MRIDRHSAVPSPGIAKTASVITAPPMKKPAWMPKTVMIGTSALRSACRRITPRGGRPLARAVRT